MKGDAFSGLVRATKVATIPLDNGTDRYIMTCGACGHVQHLERPGRGHDVRWVICHDCEASIPVELHG